MDLEFEPSDELLESGERPVKNVSLRVDVYFLPEFYANNQFVWRSDLRVPRRKIGSLHDTEDLEGTVRQFAKSPGAYFAECRLGHEVIASDVFELKPKGQSLVMESPRATTAPPQPVIQVQPTPQPEPSSASSINATTETIRATKELLKEVAPPSTAPAPLTKEDVQAMITQAVAAAVAQVQSTQKPETETAPDPTDQLLKTASAFKQLGIIREPEEKKTTPDPTEAFLSTYERFLDISERINPEAKERRGFFDKAVGAVESLANAAPRLAPVLAPIVNQAVNQMRANTAQGQQQPQPTATAQTEAAQSEPTDEMQAITRVAQTIAEEFQKGHRVGHTADVVEETLVKFPALQPQLNALLSDSPSNIILGVRSFGIDMPQTKAAFEWIADLQDELSDETEGENEIEIAPSENNGHKVASAAPAN